MLGEIGAAELYEAFLDDVCETVRSLEGVERELWVPPRPDAERYFTDRCPDFRLRWQRGSDLGDRLRAAFETAFEEGAGCALAVGSDHPTLPRGHLEAAFAPVRPYGLQLGPTDDGGYWGLGLAHEAWSRARALFGELPWSTPRLARATRERALELGLSVRELPAWYDVDDPSGLERLKADLERGSRTARALARLTARRNNP